MQTFNERRRGFSLRRQLRSLTPLAVLWLVGLVVLLAAEAQTAAPLQLLFLDPARLTGSPWYTGAMSNLGIMVWTSSVAFASAGAWVAHRIGRASAARFLTVGAIATLILVLDDAFQLHAVAIKHAIGGSKNIAQILVVLPVVVWVVVFFNDIMRTRSALLFAALGSLAGSVLMDLLFALDGDSQFLIEDGMKFLGILAWAQYFAITSRDIAASVIGEVVGNDDGNDNGNDGGNDDEATPTVSSTGVQHIR